MGETGASVAGWRSRQGQEWLGCKGPANEVGHAGLAMRKSGFCQKQSTATSPFARIAICLLPLIMIFINSRGGIRGALGAAPADTANAKSGSETVSKTGNPQVAEFSLSLPAGASAIVQFGLTAAYGFETSSLAAPPKGGRVNFLVAGMLAHTTYHMRSLVTDSDASQQVGDDHTFVTGGLPPKRIPDASVVQTGTPNPGIELLDLVPLVSSQLHTIHTAATDLSGNLIWYYDPPSESYAFPIKLLPNGQMMLVVVPLNKNGFQGIREIDLAGRTISQLSVGNLNNQLKAARIPWRAVVMHHDFLTLNNGHLILLVQSNKTFNNLPGYPGKTNVIGDGLVDLDVKQNVAWTWLSFNYLDVNRHPLNFSQTDPDWTHSNALIYSPDDGDLILSMRDQDWVIKIDYENGKGDGHIIWRLGPGGDFTLQPPAVDPTDWNYGQHYPTIVSPNSSGTFDLGLMDNGSGRVINGQVCGTSGGPACYSRAVIFQLDEQQMTATVIWQDSPLKYSLCCGNTEVLDNGDIEFNLAFTMPAMVEQVTSDVSPSPVWQMTIPGQVPYRAFRLPSLYPNVQWGE